MLSEKPNVMPPISGCQCSSVRQKQSRLTPYFGDDLWWPPLIVMIYKFCENTLSMNSIGLFKWSDTLQWPIDMMYQ